MYIWFFIQTGNNRYNFHISYFQIFKNIYVTEELSIAKIFDN